MGAPYRGKIELGALLGQDAPRAGTSSRRILALVGHDTFNPDPSSKGDVWESVLAWVDLASGECTPLRNSSGIYDKYGDCVAGVDAYDAKQQVPAPDTISV